MELAGKRVVITGASRGLGAAFARQFADAGARVVLVARNQALLAEVAEETNGEAIVGDLLDDDFVEGLIDQVAATGPIDVVVNNAGMEVASPFVEQTPDAIRSVLRLNVETPALLCRSAIEHFGSRPGWLVNVSSLAMAVDTPGFATYGASKAALSALSSTLRFELRDTAIGMTVVEIGIADTDMASDLLASGGAVAAMFGRYDKFGLSPMLDPADVARELQLAIEGERAYVRLPKRGMLLPMLTNVVRRTGAALHPGDGT